MCIRDSEWVDPIADASGLPATEMQALPEGADAKTKRYHEVFAAVVQEWWAGRRNRE